MVIFRESVVAEEYILILNVVKHVHKYTNLQCQVKKKLLECIKYKIVRDVSHFFTNLF